MEGKWELREAEEKKRHESSKLSSFFFLPSFFVLLQSQHRDAAPLPHLHAPGCKNKYN